MSGKSATELLGGSRQRQRWADNRLWLIGAISLEEYEQRERAYEPDYEAVMLGLARNNNKDENAPSSPGARR